MTWQEVVKLLRDVFAYSEIQVVAYTLESHGFHTMSSEVDPKLNAEVEIEPCSADFYVDDEDL